MPSKLPQPRVDAAIGRTASGELVMFDPNWFRGFIADLRTRVGGDEAMTNLDLEALALELNAYPATDTTAQAAQRLAEDLHGELAALRGAIDAINGRIEDLANQMDGLRIPADLTNRVQTLEDRLQ